MTIKNTRPKAKKAMYSLLSRQDYLVTQGNDLAKSFGNLSAFEHKVLDYCFSFVKKDDKPEQEYTVNALDIIHHLGLNTSGENYKRIGLALKSLNEKTAMYAPITTKKGKKGIMMFQLFGHISYMEDGQTTFSFSREASPYVFDLVSTLKFYSFKLSELSRVKSKYGLILLKLWESKRMGNNNETTISGSIDEWKDWFMGDNKKLKRKWTAGRFKQQCVMSAIKSLDKVYPNSDFDLTTIYDHKKTIGFELNITGNPHGK